MATLVDQLKEIRKRAKLTQDAIGTHLGVSRVQVSRIEGGSRGTSVELIEHWLDVCGYELMPVQRDAPDAGALAAELGNAEDQDRALVLRVLRLLTRLDDRSRRMLANFVSTLEADVNHETGRNSGAADDR